MAFYYIRPDEMWSLGATVTTTVGTTDTDYTDDWIVDGRAGRPARATSGTVTWSAAFSSAEVGLIAVCNCSSNVNATIGGSVSGTVLAGALGENGIRLNGWLAPTIANMTTLTVGFSGASANVTLGEFAFGKRRALTNIRGGIGGPRLRDATFTDDDFDGSDETTLFLPPYDRGLERRRLSGTNVFTTAQLDTIRAWRRAQKSSTKPSLIVPDSSINDAWLCRLIAVTYKPAMKDGQWTVDLAFEEYPRVRW